MLASKIHEKRVLELLGRLLGALGGVLERLGLILERLGGVLERLARALRRLGTKTSRVGRVMLRGHSGSVHNRSRIAALLGRRELTISKEEGNLLKESIQKIFGTLQTRLQRTQTRS